MSIDVLRAGWRGGAESGGVEICGHECVRSGLRMRWRSRVQGGRLGGEVADGPHGGGDNAGEILSQAARRE